MLLPEIFNSEQPVLVSYGADWCEPCQWAKPIVEEVIKNFGGKISLYNIDIDQQPELSREQHVLSVPTLILMQKGKELWRMRGFDTAPNLIRILEKFV